MKTKKIILVLIVAIIIVSILITFKITGRIIEDKEKAKGIEDNTGNNDQEIPQLKPTSETESAGGTGRSSGGDDGGTGGIGSIENKTLPPDINSQPCSFYFSEYGVCAGTCPSGFCVQEGRSCYCKEVWIKL